MKNTHIIVLRKKQLFLIAGLIILFILLFFLLRENSSPGASPENTENPESAPTLTQSVSDDSAVTYRPGVYTSTVVLNDTTLSLEIIVDREHINSIRFLHLEEAVTTMYPLLEPALSSLFSQLSSGVSPSEIRISDTEKYTELFLLNAIQETLMKAAG